MNNYFYYTYDIEYDGVFYEYKLRVYKYTLTYEKTTADKELIYVGEYNTYADAMFALIYLDDQLGNIIDE